MHFTLFYLIFHNALLELLFSFFDTGTIRQNLDPFSEHSDEEIWKVLEEVGLREFYSRKMPETDEENHSKATLENGLEFNISPFSFNLSSGQRELLCLARALLRNRKIYIFESPHSFVNGEHATSIQNSIKTRFSESTFVAIKNNPNHSLFTRYFC